jgi:hypothetical protein
MDWFEKWKIYTGYDKVKLPNDMETPGSTNGTQSTKHEEDEMMSDDFHKM